jgi:hypothetical protein
VLSIKTSFQGQNDKYNKDDKNHWEEHDEPTPALIWKLFHVHTPLYIENLILSGFDEA